jgi:uncharacterized protein YndB with AHSA1/START domain
MAAIEMKWAVHVDSSADRVFALLAELRDYERWLPRSDAFHGTLSISDGPIAVGTTYVEPGPLGTRYGRVTELTPPTRLCFEQPMTLKPRFMGVIGIELSHDLTPVRGGVDVVRTLRMSPRGPVRLAMPLVRRAFRIENERMMKALKAFAESR